MQIRPAREDDLVAITDAWYAMMADAGLLAQPLPAQWRERFGQRVVAGLREGSSYWLVTEAANGTIVATGGATLTDRHESIIGLRAVIVGMYTAPEFRHRGYARAIVERLVQWCRERGCSEVRLQASNAGRPLYASLGFVPSNQMMLEL